MQNITTVTTIQDAVKVLIIQLEGKNYYLHNYRLLNNIEDYLDKCEDKDSKDFDKGEQIFNYLTYDLKWEDQFDELFPMSL